MRRRRHLRHVGEKLHVLRPVVEIIIADQHAERLAAELAVFLLIDAAEQRALVPGGATELAQAARQFALGDVEQLDLERRSGLRIADQEAQAAPRRLHLLELGMVQDDIELFAEQPVDLADHGLDAPAQSGRVDRRRQRGAARRTPARPVRTAGAATSRSSSRSRSPPASPPAQLMLIMPACSVISPPPLAVSSALAVHRDLGAVDRHAGGVDGDAVAADLQRDRLARR